MGRRCSIKDWPISISWSKRMTQLPKTLVRPRGAVGSVTGAPIDLPFSIVLITGSSDRHISQHHALKSSLIVVAWAGREGGFIECPWRFVCPKAVVHRVQSCVYAA